MVVICGCEEHLELDCGCVFCGYECAGGDCDV